MCIETVVIPCVSAFCVRLCVLRSVSRRFAWQGPCSAAPRATRAFCDEPLLVSCDFCALWPAMT